MDYRGKASAPSKILAHIAPQVRHLWWRGYSDGDGCFMKGRLSVFTLTSCREQDWSFYAQLCKDLGVDQVRVRRQRFKHGSENSSVVVSSKRLIEKLGSYFYQGYETDGIGLQRKRAVFQSIVQSIKKRSERHSRFKWVCRGRSESWMYCFVSHGKRYAYEGFKTDQLAHEACLAKRQEVGAVERVATVSVPLSTCLIAA